MDTLFKKQFDAGKSNEDKIANYFTNDGWTVTQLSQYDERKLKLGDKHFAKGSCSFNVEIKQDGKAAYTGNLFLEIVSVNVANVAGWMETTNSAYVITSIPPLNKILIFRTDVLRDNIDDLKSKFKVLPTRKELNKGYRSLGIIVPLEYAEKHLALKVINDVDFN